MLHRCNQLISSILVILWLGIFSGCSDSSSKPSQSAQKGDQATALQHNPPAASPPGAKPGFPLAKPPIVPAPSSPPQSATLPTPASTASQPAHNTRPVGPYGIRQITLGLNDLRQAGLLLLGYYDQNHCWPRNEAELRDALREMPAVYKAIQIGDYIFAPAKNLNLVPGTQTVLIYEKLPDKAGTRLVLFGDGSVKRLNAAEFAQLKLPPP
ncbi:hypothetical protein HRbin36_00935 [bacterium HR36]|nr:hypothetical protein HRbin36_00935 [bacterium HR36]